MFIDLSFYSHKNAVENLAAVAARTDELFIRILEAVMMDVAERKGGEQHRAADLEQPAAARKLIVALLKEIHYLGTVHLDALEQAAESIPAEGDNVAQAKQQLNELTNGLIADQADAVLIVHDGAKHLLPAFRLLAKAPKE